MKRLKLAVGYMGGLFAVSIVISYIMENEFNTSYIMGQATAGLLIGIFLAPHFHKAGDSKAQRKKAMRKVITNAIYLFLGLFVVIFSMNFIFDSMNWTVTAISGIPLLLFLLIRLMYRKKK